MTFGGEGATARTRRPDTGRDRQFNDVHLDVRHEVPHCTSRETFKGILDGSGRVVSIAISWWRVMPKDRCGVVEPQPDAGAFGRGGPNRSSKSMPMMWKCSHGTTVGELDPDMLFYLRSRGIRRIGRNRCCARALRRRCSTRWRVGAAGAGQPVAGITVAGVDLEQGKGDVCLVTQLV